MSASVREMLNAYNARAPLTDASTPPSSWYTDSRILELEKQSVFSRTWQLAGRADQVCRPGQYVTTEIGGEPVLVIRGSDRMLRGFYNVCRHHAAAVMTRAEGQTDALRCPYHGWTYDLTGALILTPEFAGVKNFDPSANRLLAVQCAEWEGWVFVKLDGAGSLLKDYLGDDFVEQHIEPLHLERLNWFERRSYRLNCNWKVFVDNYLDGGYHIPRIHKGLDSVLAPGKYRIELGERFCLQSSLMLGAGTSQTAAVRAGERALYYWLYPNFMINIYEGLMDTHVVIPLAMDWTEVIFDFYFADVSEAAGERNRASIAVSEQIQNEDAAICESVQRGLRSRAYDTGRLSVRREAGEHLFHRLLYNDLNSAVVKE